MIENYTYNNFLSCCNKIYIGSTNDNLKKMREKNITAKKQTSVSSLRKELKYNNDRLHLFKFLFKRSINHPWGSCVHVDCPGIAIR